MIFPAFIKKGCTIGITALSDGNKKETDFVRLDSGKKQLAAKGYKLLETTHVRSSNKGRSTDGETRAEEFLELIKNEDVMWIISAKGGDYLMEMLPYVDFNEISLNPKWIQGYSDNTGITFTVTTNCDMATVYGCNFNDFGMEPWHRAIKANLNMIEGNDIVQTSFDFYEDGFYDRITGLESYNTDKEVYWRNITGQEEIKLNGRLLGGCLDVLLNLVGTKYDKTVRFIEKYKDDGIIWYLESFSLNSEALTRGLWQLREAGWFQTAKGFVFGRPAFYDEQGEISYEEAVLSVLGGLEVPVILDADIGHKAPAMAVINGSLGFISCKNGKGSLKMMFL
ncbi:hypothetical protein Ana3638_11230 [Anaerocolumna sedimenticola]|uniref:LD-carboxypeptidase n=1 Tax=Anaerocolumna sedimenticola TaxID=2696063 RepID=A0A6P1TNR1_9FIRM|nr:S66 peptidase family protein [Anaerocolumna sedimenticola]QHQ61275.1 hypothetical protein Ana3638_11230 [Anaerocolumna sedimenticola]